MLLFKMVFKIMNKKGNIVLFYFVVLFFVVVLIFYKILCFFLFYNIFGILNKCFLKRCYFYKSSNKIVDIIGY